MQEPSINDQIKRCENVTLRDAAIAAIYRGSLEDQNRTLYECIAFNRQGEREKGINDRKRDFTALSKWFTQRFPAREPKS